MVIDTKPDLTESQDRVYAPELGSQLVMQTGVHPCSDTYAISADIADKHRRIWHDPEPGDITEAANSLAHITGVDLYRTMTQVRSFNLANHVDTLF